MQVELSVSELLEKSIEKWEKILLGKADYGGRDCALCGAFFWDGCVECPVCIHSGHPECIGTPYRAWKGHLWMHTQDGTDEDCLICEECHRLAMNALNFLKDLREEKNEKTITKSC